jgi:hypothetical protein
MPDYNTARQLLGLTPITSWSNLTSDQDIIVRAIITSCSSVNVVWFPDVTHYHA